MSIKPDVWIKRMAESEGMIEPFSEKGSIILSDSAIRFIHASGLIDIKLQSSLG